MGIGHERLAATRRLRDQVTPLIEGWQSIIPDQLMPRAYVVSGITDVLMVTRQAASRHIAEAVSAGDLVEIIPRPDWEVSLPGGEDLPTVYAHRRPVGASTYVLQYDRPLLRQTRGAGRTTFISTPQGLQRMLPMVRRQLGVPEPDPSIAGFYLPAVELMLRPAMYGDLLNALVCTNPSKLTASQAQGVLEALLQVLKLRAPTLPHQKRSADG